MNSELHPDDEFGYYPGDIVKAVIGIWDGLVGIAAISADLFHGILG